jgi:hypothetical protein
MRTREAGDGIQQFEDQWVSMAVTFRQCSPTRAVSRYAGSRRVSDSHHGFADSPVTKRRHPFGILKREPRTLNPSLR